MKLGVIGGAGVLGSTGAYYAAVNNLVDEIILYDIQKEAAQNHAMDIDQGVCEFSSTKTRAGDFDDLATCGIILNTVGVADRNEASRDAYLEENLKICLAVAERIKRWGTHPVVISATNPIDVLNYSIFAAVGGDPARFIGYSKNDTLRFKWSISLETGIPAADIEALTIGEHGAKQVSLFSSIRKKNTGEPLFFSDEQRNSIQQRVDNWFGTMASLGVLRTMGWTSAIGMGQIIEAVATDRGMVIPCSVIPNGEYGLSGLSIGLPARLGKQGIAEIIEVPLSVDEQAALNAAADKIKKSLPPAIRSGRL